PPSAPEAEQRDHAAVSIDEAPAPEPAPLPSSPPSAPEAEQRDQADHGAEEPPTPAEPTPEPAAVDDTPAPAEPAPEPPPAADSDSGPSDHGDTVESDPAVGDVPPV
ncbi:MAG TPA: hypothetical protein VFV63_19025, partial [Ilumatobacteraceae bacterium]|nr:hypothetical protein [Ilumatobacteraceae bacterium]